MRVWVCGCMGACACCEAPIIGIVHYRPPVPGHQSPLAVQGLSVYVRARVQGTVKGFGAPVIKGYGYG